MPRLKNAVPKYRKHKASGQAVVTLSGVDHYLGKHGSKPSRMLDDRLVGEWMASGRAIARPASESFTVSEWILRYLRFANTFYRRPDGTSTDTAANMRPAMRTLRELYGDVDEFGPIALKVVRQAFVDSGNTRGYCNTNVDRIRRMFRWAVAEELVRESTLRRLESVTGLKKGKTAAPDNPPVPPVGDDIVDQTISQLPLIVAAMVQIQRLTGMRPGEVCIMRPAEIDQSGEAWIFVPERHKTEHHGKRRAVVKHREGPQLRVRSHRGRFEVGVVRHHRPYVTIHHRSLGHRFGDPSDTFDGGAKCWDEVKRAVV